MKKFLIIVILGGAGFWYYKNVYSLPIYGTWAPNEKEFMRKAYEKAAMTPEQEKYIKSYISNTRVIIEHGDIEFKFPDRGGKSPYKVTNSGNNCYLIDVPQLGAFDSCIQGNSMTMRNSKTGYVETYDKI